MAISAVANLVDRINAELAPSGRHEVEWQGPASEEDLTAIEGRLGCRLPASFREFLRLTGGGGLRSLWVSTAAVNDVRGSVIGDTLGWREDFGLPQHLVVIQPDLDDNEPFCLDTSAFDANECPVVLFYANARKSATERVAPGFVAWYAKYLSPYFNDGATADA
jgi:hypothetical protein